ncbi:MAG: TolC family protein [Candidatus Aminicenantes bacterium]|nr:TolC family protein [Candidatus Aminicenantes bacterium]
MKKISFLKILGLAVVLTAAAACVRFHPKPIAPVKAMEDFEARRLDAPELRDFLLRNQDAKDWPPAAWDLKSLTLAAFYYHSDMDVARAQWGVARGGRITAGERPNPSLNPALGYNATSPRSEVTPWIPEISLEITIETAGKRGYRIAEARSLSEAARWNILSAAWEVRSRLRNALLEAYAAGEREALLTEARKLQAEIVRILELLKDAGEVSVYDLTQARLALDGSRLAAIEAARAKEEAMARLAAALGLPRRALDGVAFSFDCFRRSDPGIPAGEVRHHAVVNRSDILAALSEYAASQSALQLEIAKQYPDIRLGPSYQLDQTDSKWTIGLAIDLPILSRNRGPIAEAEARRTESAARFLALQSQVIGELDAAVEDCRSALLKSQAADDLLANLARQEAAAKTRREVGEISKLELLGVQIELNAGAEARLEALVQAQEAVGRLENAAQSPLDVRDWFFTKTREDSGPAKERKDD